MREEIEDDGFITVVPDTRKNPLTELLRPHVKDLERAMQDGDEKARQVIELYEMHRACPSDPAAPAFCEAMFLEWQRENQ